ncbi:hypothetical protein KC321_g9 [Hortaea werneckii]|nr:hypothetical protein KC321_g9 [Hortaea werneckii]
MNASGIGVFEKERGDRRSDKERETSRLGSHAGCKGRAYATIHFGTSGLDSATNATADREGNGLAKRHYHIVPTEVTDNAAHMRQRDQTCAGLGTPINLDIPQRQEGPSRLSPAVNAAKNANKMSGWSLSGGIGFQRAVFGENEEECSGCPHGNGSYGKHRPSRSRLSHRLGFACVTRDSPALSFLRLVVYAPGMDRPCCATHCRRQLNRVSIDAFLSTVSCATSFPLKDMPAIENSIVAYFVETRSPPSFVSFLIVSTANPQPCPPSTHLPYPSSSAPPALVQVPANTVTRQRSPYLGSEDPDGERAPSKVLRWAAIAAALSTAFSLAVEILEDVRKLLYVPRTDERLSNLSNLVRKDHIQAHTK